MNSKPPRLAAVLSLLAVFAALPAEAGETVPYVVRAGDTLTAIAARNTTTVRAILLENDIADPNRIREGQTIFLPAPPKPVAPATPARPAIQSVAPAVPVASPAQAKPTANPYRDSWHQPAVRSDPVFHEPAVRSDPPHAPAVRNAPALKEPSFYDVWIRDRLSLGLSLSYAKLTDADRPEDEDRKRTFLGYVNHLSLENKLGFAPTINWLACEYVRIGLTFHKTEVRTLNFIVAPEIGKKLSDGNATETGLILSLEGTYPFVEGKLRPHAGVGLGWYRGDFKEDTWWRLGYPSPLNWEEAGRPSSGSAIDRYRSIQVDDAFGMSALAGVAWRPARHIEIDLSLRKTWLNPDCNFGYDMKDTGERVTKLKGDFSMDTIAAVLTVSWVF